MSQKPSWIATCPARTKRRICTCRNSGFVVKDHNDPTKFTIRSTDSKEAHCTIGNPHRCSCSSSQPCAHVLFILLTVFRVRENNAALWQRGVSEAEFSEWMAEKNVRENCHFCHEIVIGGSDCERCGTRTHEQCARLASLAGRCRPNFCPRCSAALPTTLTQHVSLCSNCHGPSTLSFYKCIFCDDCVLCSRCYNTTAAHSNHPFSHQGAKGASLSVSPSTRVEVADLQFREINPEDYEALSSLDSLNRKGLSPSILSALPRVKYAEARSTNEVCPVCQQDFATRDFCLVLPCAHAMHQVCGERWLSAYSDQCPIDHKSVQACSGSAVGKCFSPSCVGGHQAAASLRCKAKLDTAEGVKLPTIVSRKIPLSTHFH